MSGEVDAVDAAVELACSHEVAECLERCGCDFFEVFAVVYGYRGSREGHEGVAGEYFAPRGSLRGDTCCRRH